MSASPPAQSHGRLRRFGTGFFLVLVCLLVVVANLATWTQQTILNTDRYVAVVGSVPSNPAVQEAIADRVSSQVVIALDLQDRIAGILPDKASALAAPITAALQERIRTQVLTIVSSDAFAQVWVKAQRALHEELVRVLRGESTVITIDHDTLYLNLLPLIGNVVSQLQQQGIIPASETLPDFSAVDPDQVRDQLQAALGITLSPTFGQLPLVQTDTLRQAQLFVKILDALVIVLWLLVVVFAALALWASANRRRMAMMLGVGAVIALLLSRLLIGGIEAAVISSISDSGSAATVKAIVDDVLANLFMFLWWSVGVAALIGLIAFFLGRPRPARPTLPSGPTVGRAQLSSEGLRTWTRAHVRQLRWVLPGIILAIVAILEVGLEMVVLVVAVIALVELGLNALTREPAPVPAAPITDEPEPSAA
ncbi:MAG: hypothetical protein ACHQXL_01080 [Candidatus Limnocylindrales bacterium]